MGNKMSMELHKWSTAEFREEYALVCNSPTENSKPSIFLLSVNPERVLLRLADSVCGHPVRLFHMEVSAQRDNMNCFNFQKVRVVVNGTQQTQSKGQDSLSDLCGRKTCFCEVMRKVSSGSTEISWEFFHSYKVNLKTHIRYHVSIQCNKERGLTATIRGPFECEGQVHRAEPVKGSLIKHEVKEEEPPKAVKAFAESNFEGKEYILFQGASDKQSVNIVNTGASFHGNGNASTFKGCKIIMQTVVKKSPSP